MGFNKGDRNQSRSLARVVERRALTVVYSVFPVITKGY